MSQLRGQMRWRDPAGGASSGEITMQRLWRFHRWIAAGLGTIVAIALGANMENPVSWPNPWQW